MPSLSHQFLNRGFVYIAGLYIFAFFIIPYLPSIQAFIKSFIKKHQPYIDSRLNDCRTIIKQQEPYINQRLNSFLTDYKPYRTSLIFKNYDYRLIPTLRLTSLFASSIITIIFYHNGCWPVTSLLSSLLSALYIHHRYIGLYLYHPKSTRQAIVVEVVKDFVSNALPINEATRQEIGFEVVEGWINNAPTKVKEFIGWLFQKESRNRRRIPSRNNHLL